MIKKSIDYLHLWLGLLSGLVVFILGLTGCLYCFEKELKSWFYADRLYVDSPGTGQKRSVDELLAIAQQAIGKERPITSMDLAPQSNRTYLFRARKTDEAGWHYFDHFQYYQTAYVNPYTGRVQAVENTKYEFFMLVLELHYSLLLGHWGEFIVKWSTVLFVVLLLSGLVLWWPKNKAAARQRFWFAWKKSTRFKRKNYDLHNVPGFYSFLLALAIALTGLVFGFQWFRQAVGWVGNGGQEIAIVKPPVSDSLQTQRVSCYQLLVSRVLSQSPRTQRIFLSLPDSTQKAFPIRLIAYRSLQSNFRRHIYFFDQFNGKLLREKAYEAQTSGEKLLAMNYDIHVGTIGSLPGKILAFLASLIATSLPVTGFLIWWGRRKKTQKPVHLDKTSSSTTRASSPLMKTKA